MSDKLQQMSIKITGVEQKIASNNSVYFNIKDENNKTYKLWKSIKDGSDSKAYQAFKTFENNGLGRTISAGVELQQGDFNGKPVTYRTIKSIGFTTEHPEPQVVSAPAHSDVNLDELANNILKANKLQIEQLTKFNNALAELIKRNDEIADVLFSEEKSPVDELEFLE